MIAHQDRFDGIPSIGNREASEAELLTICEMLRAARSPKAARKRETMYLPYVPYEIPQGIKPVDFDEVFSDV